uniref:Uncharacterized protein n=1 Tax=Anguilla anguilla TaxID=7936 RepID=A0A0E9PLY1_ANGAN
MSHYADIRGARSSPQEALLIFCG